MNTKNTINGAILSLLLILSIGAISIVSAGTTHTVWGYCHDAIDGTPVVGSTITLYIDTRPNEVLTTTVQTGNPPFWTADTGDFPTNWQIGETLIVKLDNGAGYTNSTSIVLSSAGSDQVPDMTLVKTLIITPDKIALVSGSGQTGTVATALANPFIFQVTNVTNATPVSGVLVNFSITSQPTGAIGASLSVLNAITGSDGNVSVTLTLGTKVGTYEVTAEFNDGQYSATASADATSGQTANVSLMANPSSVQVGMNSTIYAKVADQYNNPIPSKTVNFSVTVGTGTVAPSSAITNADGIATTTYTAPTKSGIETVKAIVDTINNTVDITVTPGSPAKAEVIANPSTIPPDGISTSTIFTTIKDQYNNPIPNKNVVFRVIKGNGTVSPQTNLTNSNGVAISTYKAPTTPGIETVASGVSKSVFGTVNIALESIQNATIGLTATLNADNSVTLSWNKSLEGAFEIYYADVPTDIDTSDPNATGIGYNWTDTDAVNHSQRYYKVKAKEVLSDETVGKFDLELIKKPDSTGVNSISLPLNTTIKTAEELAQAIPYADTVTMWDPLQQKRIGHPKGVPFNNFDVMMGQGYLVSVTQNTTFTLVGEVPFVVEPIELIKKPDSTGVNFIGLPLNTTIKTAEELVQAIPYADTVTMWDSLQQKRIGHPKGVPFNNFDVMTGQGYLVSVTQNTTWTPI